MQKAIMVIQSVLIWLAISAACSVVEQGPGLETVVTAADTIEEFEQAEYIKPTPEEIKEMMETMDVIVVDVRTEEEFIRGHI